VAGEAQWRFLTAKISGWGCRGTPSGPQPSKRYQRNLGSQRAWHTPRRAEASARTPIIGVEERLYARDRRKTTKKLKPNSLQSPNGLPPHKRLMGWQGEGLASGPDSGWPRVRGLLGWPRLPRIPSVVEPPLVSVGLPRGRQAGVAPAIHTGVRGWAQQGRGPESSVLSCVAEWPRKT
jgi:hypothetical protein